MKKSILALAVIGSLSLHAGNYDPVKGEMLSLSCVSCHGTNGKSVGIMPSIAGMGKVAMQMVLMAYKNGEIEGTIMQKHAKGFSDYEIEQIAYYFSKNER